VNATWRLTDKGRLRYNQYTAWTLKEHTPEVFCAMLQETVPVMGICLGCGKDCRSLTAEAFCLGCVSSTIERV
jgi:hypothetical protein